MRGIGILLVALAIGAGACASDGASDSGSAAGVETQAAASTGGEDKAKALLATFDTDHPFAQLYRPDANFVRLIESELESIVVAQYVDGQRWCINYTTFVDLEDIPPLSAVECLESAAPAPDEFQVGTWSTLEEPYPGVSFSTVAVIVGERVTKVRATAADGSTVEDAPVGGFAFVRHPSSKLKLVEALDASGAVIGGDESVT